MQIVLYNFSCASVAVQSYKCIGAADVDIILTYVYSTYTKKASTEEKRGSFKTTILHRSIFILSSTYRTPVNSVMFAAGHALPTVKKN